MGIREKRMPIAPRPLKGPQAAQRSNTKTEMLYLGGVDRAQLLAGLGELGCLQWDRLPLDLRR